TGVKADHRLAMRPTDIGRLAAAIAARLGAGGTGNQFSSENWFEPLIRDLLSHSGSSIVIAGESQPPEVHALAHAINEKLGNAGLTIEYSQSTVRVDSQIQSLRELVQAMQSGQINT